MRKLLSLITGLTLGAGVGVVFVTLFSPISGQELRQNIRQHYQQALADARQASADKRQELEAELAQMREAS